MDFSDVNVDMVRLSGEGNGTVAARLLTNNMDPNCLRPYFSEQDGRPYITANRGTADNPDFYAKLTANALFRENEWRAIDAAVVDVSKPVLKAVGDLRAAGCVRTLDGMANPVISYETSTDIPGATISMSGLRRGERDRWDYGIINQPLPIIHKDVSWDLRALAASRRAGTPLDTTWIRKASRRVAEMAEAMLIGNIPAFTFGSVGGVSAGAVYGYRTHPNRITKVMTLPTDPSWTPQLFIDEILDMRQSLTDKFRPGPYVVYLSSSWDKYLDTDYSAAYNGNTLRVQLSKVGKVARVDTLDYLTGYQVLMIQMTSDVVQEVVGMDIRTLQWEEQGGMELCLKVMCILVPQIRTDTDTNIGIAHGTAA